MTPFEAFLLGTAGVLAAIALVALRFPRGRREWPLDARRTAWLLASAAVTVALFVLLYVATRDLVWPGIETTTFAAAGTGLALLLVASLFLPQGLRSRP